jgi:hypothetical protein
LPLADKTLRKVDKETSHTLQTKMNKGKSTH